MASTFQLIVRGTIALQETNNIFYYEAAAPEAGAAEDLTTAFIDRCAADWLGAVSSAWGFKNASCVDLLNPGDLFESAFGGVGSLGGDVYSPFVAFTFKYNRSTTLVRNGSKRIAGVPESCSSDGIAITSGQRALLDVLANDFSATLTGDITNYTPVIFHKTNVPPDPLAGISYPITSVSYSHIGSQNTRKVGRGI
jgi:hypothetical protein